MSKKERQTCPRRVEGPLTAQQTDADTWAKRPGDAFRSCSYCGSMHPDDLLDAVTKGFKVGPTDKVYKIYVGMPTFAKFYTQHFMEHEDTSQQFANLYSAQGINWDFPGYPYAGLWAPTWRIGPK